jgi:hypothetical protein
MRVCISLEDCNNENSSDHLAEEDEDVEENVAVKENTVYGDGNVDASAVSLLGKKQNYDELVAVGGPVQEFPPFVFFPGGNPFLRSLSESK